jgi:hypothetical protein
LRQDELRRLLRLTKCNNIDRYAFEPARQRGNFPPPQFPRAQFGAYRDYDGCAPGKTPATSLWTSPDGNNARHHKQCFPMSRRNVDCAVKLLDEFCVGHAGPPRNW